MKWLLIVILLFCGGQVKKPPQTYAEKQALRIAIYKLVRNSIYRAPSLGIW